jgi:hypothetical protein
MHVPPLPLLLPPAPLLLVDPPLPESLPPELVPPELVPPELVPPDPLSSVSPPLLPELLPELLEVPDELLLPELLLVEPVLPSPPEPLPPLLLVPLSWEEGEDCPQAAGPMPTIPTSPMSVGRRSFRMGPSFSAEGYIFARLDYVSNCLGFFAGWTHGSRRAPP